MEAKSKESKGFIIDGFPVSSAQAKLFEEKIGSPAKILYLCVNDVILKERLVKRSKNTLYWFNTYLLLSAGSD